MIPKGSVDFSRGWRSGIGVRSWPPDPLHGASGRENVEAEAAAAARSVEEVSTGQQVKKHTHTHIHTHKHILEFCGKGK